MGTPFKAQRVAKDIYWVGAIDWAVRDFHGYRTSRGTTYNAYLILGEKTVLVDTVKAEFQDELLSRIASVIDPTKIDYIISNHAEMDHSGCLPELIRIAQPEAVFASPKGVEALQAHFGDLNLVGVKDGEHIQVSGAGSATGPLSVRFVQTPFLHWPDSMFSFVPERHALFCQDAFGMHLASAERFAEALPDALLEEEAARYFANILLPFSGFITKLFDKLEKADLDIRIALPDHGPIWGARLPLMFGWYQRWAAQVPSTKAVVVYDSMWESTETMARAVVEGLTAAGAQVKVMPLAGSHRSDIATELLDAGALVVGSPTLNNQIFPTVADALCYAKGLKRKNLVGAAFGSYGWSGEGVRQLEEHLADMGVEVLPGLRTQFVPRSEVMDQCRELGERVGARLMAREMAPA